MIATQTWAILVDVYRELNAKKLFWITMALSLLVVLAFAAVGLNDKGMTVLWWTLEIPGLNSTAMDPADFYKLTFTGLGVQIWLTWVAAILALVSTASMIPDMLAGGSIELVLARPIARTRLFLTKYIAGLMFVFLQVLVFSTASFFVIGIRGGAWEPGLFLAVPIVTLFFSYLFGVCVLFGVMTRSAIASLLLTLLVWFLTFAMNATDMIMLMQKEKARLSVDRHASVLAETRPKIAALEAELAEARERVAAGAPAEDAPEVRRLESRIGAGNAFVARIEADAPGHARSLETLTKWHRLIFGVKTVLPKTTETTELLNRWLVDLADLPDVGPSNSAEMDPDFAALMGGASPGDAKVDPPKPRSVQVRDDDPELNRVVQERIRERSVWWVIGTSLGFEAVCVGIAVLIFSRRDF
jgi:ABC-type transport system involved in multi-copper enzyme maturation permease subunit